MIFTRLFLVKSTYFVLAVFFALITFLTNSHLRCNTVSHMGCFSISPEWSALSISDKMWASPNSSFVKMLANYVNAIRLIGHHSLRYILCKIITFSVLQILCRWIEIRKEIVWGWILFVNRMPQKIFHYLIRRNPKLCCILPALIPYKQRTPICSSPLMMQCASMMMI